MYSSTLASLYVAYVLLNLHAIFSIQIVPLLLLKLRYHTASRPLLLATCNMRAIIALTVLTAACTNAVRTPFGDFAPECVRGVPSGTTLTDLGSHTHVAYPDGSSELVSACSILPPNPRQRTSDGAAAKPDSTGRQLPPVWAGWPQHYWFGLGYAPFTDPPFPSNQSIWSLSADWTVPPMPANTAGNASDPWFQAAPTQSWWIGVQGGAVLQPVLEFNGLAGARAYDAVSWNCCPGNMSWYSFPLAAFPGELFIGSIARVASEVGPGSGYTFETVSTIVSPSRGTHTTRLYSNMSLAGAGWTPQWAEVVQESYFVTRCDQLPCVSSSDSDSDSSSSRHSSASISGGELFGNISLSVIPRSSGTDGAPVVPIPVPLIPWQQTYEVEGASPPGPAICSGATATDDAASATISYDCTAQH